MTDKPETARQCIKCGSDDIYMRWHKSSDDCCIEYRFRKDHFGIWQLYEHLHMTCRGCGYEWDEPCLDAVRRRD